MPTIILFRHGQTHWNRVKRIQGHTDAASPLTLKGVEQAKSYGAAVRSLIGNEAGWRVLSSPLARCVQTAAVLCETAGLPFHEIEYDPRLIEVGTGVFTGLLKSELDERHPELMSGTGRETWFFRCPGGETLDDMARRIADWLAARHAGEKLVVVTHGVAGKVLRALYAGGDPETGITEDSPQDAFFVLAGGSVRRMACAEPAG
ncbi:MAG: histidine phosphatase family protein [Magnetospirillum sp.]|nr:histidine phosphatase family protein [Magnetospirillum sp.]